jgi:ABC-type polysaccharide/polyol phosphate transport system ATPase subunit
MANDVAVSVAGLSKAFKVPMERRNRLREHMVNLFRSPGYRRLEALKGVDIEVRSGEFFGIIGRNGSGKSTLLKIIAGIYQPTQGKVKISGRLSPFIELGVGFNPELTARDNVFLNGAILGLDRKDVAAQFDEIIGFAELEEFVDQKLKNFSSGMLVRLAFSVAIRAHADILLIDEVLAVGDFEFQQKCYGVFRRMKAEGKTIIFVSHDLGSINEFSDRVLILDHGITHGVFPPSTAIDEYHRLVTERADGSTARQATDNLAEHQLVDEKPSIRGVALLGKSAEPTHAVHRGEAVTVVVTVGNAKRMPVNIGVAVYRIDGVQCFGTNTFIPGTAIPREDGVQVELAFSEIGLQKGNYYLLVGVWGDKRSTLYEMQDHAYEFQVDQRDEYQGLAYLPHTWRVREGPQPDGC